MEHLRAYLKQIPKGSIADPTELAKLLAGCWDEFVGDYGGMAPHKLHGRMEQVLWKPPMLDFVIERHGATVMGSSRAELQHWTVNIEQKTANMQVVSYRQISPRQASVDINPIAKKLVSLIISGRQDERLQWFADGRVRLLTRRILSSDLVPKQTFEGHRKRLRKAMEKRLAPHGWQCLGSWWERKK